jgi:hemerythrin-like metal-binding protein
MSSEDLVLGDVNLDADHQQLDTHIRQLLQASPQQQPAILAALRAHAAQHFATEDEDLRIIKGGNATCHIDEHASVLKSLDEVSEALGSTEWTDEAKQDMVQRLATQLLGWLPYHVQEMDTGVATWRARQRLGGVPMQIQRRPRS